MKDGATIAGIKPVSTPSLSDDGQVFKTSVDAVWNTSNKKVFTGQSLSDVLQALKISPDFTYTKPLSNTKLMYVHRKLSDRDIYWINSRNEGEQDVDVTFKIGDKVPEIWHAETGKTEPTSYTIANGVTKISLHLSSNDAVFVIFKDKALKTSVTLPAPVKKELLTIAGSWKVNFQEGRGAPAMATFDKLASFSENADPGIKYFSGTATYSKIITANSVWFKKDTRLWIDFGEIKNIAEVSLNGKSLGIIWKQPFIVDVTNALKPGANTLQVKVTNLWVNRLIGDVQPGVASKITYTTIPFYQAGSALQPSGLLGPVRIISVNSKF